jgi:hypothetical protein
MSGGMLAKVPAKIPGSTAFSRAFPFHPKNTLQMARASPNSMHSSKSALSMAEQMTKGITKPRILRALRSFALS